ncbi:hypothetical protein ACP70R_009299 [Stipagrostis hirtigluma subsp. patula]
MRGDTPVSNYCKFDSQLLTAFTSSLYVAGLLTTFLASRITAGCGRCTSMVLGGAAFLAGAAKICGADVGNELDDIVATNSAPAEGEQYRPQLVMAVMIPFFQQVIGINAIAFYTLVLLHTIGMGESASLLSAVVRGVVGVGPMFLSMLAVDRFRRRTLFLVGDAQMLASQVLIGAIMAATPRDDGGRVSKAVAGVMILLITVYVAGFGRSQKGFIHLEKLLDFITFFYSLCP